MAVPGSNLKYANTKELWRRFFKLLGFIAPPMMPRMPVGTVGGLVDDGTSLVRKAAICSKTSATAPTTDTAADAPTGAGDICVLIHNTTFATTAIYRCTAYVDTTHFTWRKMDVA